MSEELNIPEQIRREEIDINSQESFFSALIKGFLWNLSHSLKLRDKYIPHYIPNTGDDTLYLEVKGQDHSKEPLETVNESFVYSAVPRAVVDPSGIAMQFGEITNPYTRGECVVQDYALSFQFRRMPLTFTFDITYVLDTFSDALFTVQQVIAHLAIIRNFSFTYLGQTITASYKLPEAANIEKQIEFESLMEDSKQKTFEMEIEVNSNMPIYYNTTAIDTSKLIRTTDTQFT